MIIASLLSLAVALYCYAISQLQQHGKLRWSKDDGSFWGTESWRRKYAKANPFDTPDNWYYRTFKIGIRERFPLSATLLVWTTDGYHLFQSLFFSFLSLSIVLAIGFNLWLFIGVLIGVRLVHWSARQILSK